MTDIPRAVEAGGAALGTAMAALDGPLAYEETAYHLPISFAVTGTPVTDADSARAAYAASGENPLVAWECVRAHRAAESGPEGPPYTGFIPDAEIRKLGYSLVDGSILGLCLIVGKPDHADVAAALCRELQEKYMLTFLAGPVVPALQEAHVRVGLEYRLVPLGSTPSHGVHFADILARVAMMFGGVAPGDAARLLAYAAERRARAMVIAFPGLSDEEVACVDALRMLGIPILHTGGYEGGDWTATEGKDAVRAGMDLLGIRVTVTAIPIPMGCSPAFEGKSIRKEEMYVEFGGGRSPAFELLRMKDPSEVEDGRVTVIGPEIEALEEGSAVPLAILVDVAGKNFRKDYEPVLERRIHNFVNYGEGSWHTAQRDLIWVRVSKEAVKNGLRIEHLGKLLAAKFRMDFPDLLDAVQVTLVTDRAEVERLEAGGRRGLRGARRPDPRDEGRRRGRLLLLHALPDLRPRPRLRHHARAARALRRHLLARRPDRPRDLAGRREPAGQEGGADRPERRRVRGREPVHQEGLARRGRPVPALRGGRVPHDRLRLLRGDRARAPRGERDHGREPRVQGRDPLGHDLLDPRRHHRRRGADAGLRRDLEGLPPLGPLPPGRGRDRAAGLAPRGPQGGARARA